MISRTAASKLHVATAQDKPNWSAAGGGVVQRMATLARNCVAAVEEPALLLLRRFDRPVSARDRSISFARVLKDCTFSVREAFKKEGSCLLTKAPGRGVEIVVKIRVEITAGLACTFLNFVFRFDLIVCFRPKGSTAIQISI